MKHNRFLFYEFSLGILLLLQIIIPKLMPIGIIATGISIILLATKKEVRFFWSQTHLLFGLFYLAYVIGLFFSHNSSEAVHVLESKMPFILFPILFLFIPKRSVQLVWIVFPLLGALFLSFILSCIGSFSCYSTTHTTSCFISSDFSPTHHPTYMAIYYLVGIVILLYHKQMVPISKKIRVSLIGVFSIGYILCMSLSALLFICILIAVIGFRFFYQKIGWLKSTGIVVVFLGSFSLLISQSEGVVYDINRTIQAVQIYLQSPREYVKNANRYLVGNEERLILWTVATEAVLEHPFGYGTGSIDLVIGSKLRSYGLNELAGRNFNPHNQYLQTWIETGIIGVVILIALLVSLCSIAWKKKNALLLFLVTSYAFNMLFESMFQRQSGIVLFVAITFITISFIHKEKITQS